MKGRFFWHLHHDVLMGYSTNIEERIDYIKTRKPEDEVPIRLKLLKPIKGKVPKKFFDRWEKCFKKEIKEFEKTHVYNTYQMAIKKAYKTAEKEVELLHKKECPNCQWNGETIFPEK